MVGNLVPVNVLFQRGEAHVFVIARTFQVLEKKRKKGRIGSDHNRKIRWWPWLDPHLPCHAAGNTRDSI